MKFEIWGWSGVISLLTGAGFCVAERFTPALIIVSFSLFCFFKIRKYRVVRSGSEVVLLVPDDGKNLILLSDYGLNKKK